MATSQEETQPPTLPVEYENEDQFREHVVARLVAMREGLCNIDFEEGSCFLFGRGKACNIKLNDVRVSNSHCRMWHEIQDREVRVYDASSNGTFINGKKIGRGLTTILRNGDVISLANTPMGISYTFYALIPSKERDDVLAQFYDVKEVLGKGAFATVKKAVCLANGKLCAIKVIDKMRVKEAKIHEQVMREIDILKSVEHPNIISYLDMIDSPSNLYIVLELANGGELFDHIAKNGPLTEKEARLAFLQILQAVAYLHRSGIVHRDLKPENILLDSGSIKISDFGLARLTRNTFSMKTLCGTPQYIAPEIVHLATLDIPSSVGYTKAVDMWSLGVILFVMLMARVPFSDETNLYSQIIACSYTFDGVGSPPISDLAKDLVNKLLKKSPVHRITADEALNHDWFNLDLGVTDPSRKNSSSLLNLRDMGVDRRVFVSKYMSIKEEDDKENGSNCPVLKKSKLQAEST